MPQNTTLNEDTFLIEFAYRLGQLSSELKDANRRLGPDDVLVLGKPDSTYESAIAEVLETR